MKPLSVSTALLALGTSAVNYAGRRGPWRLWDCEFGQTNTDQIWSQE